MESATLCIIVPFKKVHIVTFSAAGARPDLPIEKLTVQNVEPVNFVRQISYSEFISKELKYLITTEALGMLRSGIDFVTTRRLCSPDAKLMKACCFLVRE